MALGKLVIFARPMLIGFMAGLCGSWFAARLMAGASKIGIACMRELMAGSRILVGLGYVANGWIVQDMGSGALSCDNSLISYNGGIIKDRVWHMWLLVWEKS